jgi:hypothetical protein
MDSRGGNALKVDSHKPVKSLETLLQIVVFAGIGAAITNWYLDDVTLGAAMGGVTYLLLALFVMVSDVVEINRELAAFRNQEESD